MKVRAPREDGATIVSPAINEIPALLRNVAATSLPSELESWRSKAREDFLLAAYRYTSQYRDAPSPDVSAPILAAGHQPELFHPGVWFKNFALSWAGRQFQSNAVNLVIDNDLATSPGVVSLAGEPNSPRRESVVYDLPSPAMPYEERTLQDVELFNTFPKRLAATFKPFGIEPLVVDAWKHWQTARKRGHRLGEILATGRHRLEHAWELQTLELPLSHLCEQEAFLQFAWHLIERANELRMHYNAALKEYRQTNRLRSKSHPAPDLEKDNEWLEAPFWFWTSASPQRRRLFVRNVAGGIELTDRIAWNATANSWEMMQEAVHAYGGKLRPRALITTMYARSLLSDVFFHGIGGAKYDELTDEISRRLFGTAPPPYITLSATCHLPLTVPSVSESDLREVKTMLREARYHPEKLLTKEMSQTANLNEAVAAKTHWLQQSGSRERHLGIENANQFMFDALIEQRTKWQDDLKSISQALSHKQLLTSREFSFCMFPENLREKLTQLVAS